MIYIYILYKGVLRMQLVSVGLFCPVWGLAILGERKTIPIIRSFSEMPAVSVGVGIDGSGNWRDQGFDSLLVVLPRPESAAGITTIIVQSFGSENQRCCPVSPIFCVFAHERIGGRKIAVPLGQQRVCFLRWLLCMLPGSCEGNPAHIHACIRMDIQKAPCLSSQGHI